jgi:hypothetical protein
VFVEQESTNQISVFLFRDKHVNNSTGFRVTWVGKSSIAPSMCPVYLQIFNRTTSLWETLAINNTASANTKFTMIAYKVLNLSNYYNASNQVSCRVAQGEGCH